MTPLAHRNHECTGLTLTDTLDHLKLAEEQHLPDACSASRVDVEQ